MTSASASKKSTKNEISPIITINKLNKWYGKFHVLKDIDLEVHTNRQCYIFFLPL